MAPLDRSSLSPWPSYHFLDGEMCSVRGSGNAFEQSPSCGHVRRAQSRWCLCADMGVKNPVSQTQALQHWVGAELLSAVKAELHHGML